MKTNQKGITLVALVITIIVLLILAGVTIASLSGDNGLMTKGTKAKEEDRIATARENVIDAFNVALTEYLDEKYVSNSAGSDDPVTKLSTLMKADDDIKDVTTFSTVSGDTGAKKCTITLTNVKMPSSGGNYDGANITVDLVQKGVAAELTNWSYPTN